MRDLESILRANEPRYYLAVEFQDEIIPRLREIIEVGEALFASKAVYFASLVRSSEVVNVIGSCLRPGKSKEIRVAAAAGLRNLKDGTTALFETALSDEDLCVRKAAIYSLRTAPKSFAVPMLLKIIQEEDLPFLKELAAKILKEIG